MRSQTPDEMKRKNNTRSSKTSDDLEVITKVQTYFPSRGTSDAADPDETSDPANPIEVDTRHYCKFCGRKREERFMRVYGRAAYGKKSWICADDQKLCLRIRKYKKGY